MTNLKKINSDKVKTYEIGELVWYRKDGMPGCYEIMSTPRRDIFFRKYYLTRYNRKDYINGLPDRHTLRLYHNRIEGKMPKPLKIR